MLSVRRSKCSVQHVFNNIKLNDIFVKGKSSRVWQRTSVTQNIYAEMKSETTNYTAQRGRPVIYKYKSDAEF